MTEFISKSLRVLKNAAVAGAVAYQALLGYNVPQYEYVKKASVHVLDIERYEGKGTVALTRTDKEPKDVAILPDVLLPYGAREDIIDHEEYHVDGFHDEFGINERIRARNGEPKFKFGSYFRYE